MRIIMIYKRIKCDVKIGSIAYIGDVIYYGNKVVQYFTVPLENSALLICCDLLVVSHFY